MPTMNISITAEMRDYINQQVSSGDYQNSSEFMRELIRNHRREKARLAIESVLIESLDEGGGEEATPEFWEKLFREAESEYQIRKRERA